MGVFFLVKDYIYKFGYNNDYSTTAKTYLRHAIFYDCSEIAIGSQKLTKKKQNRRSEKFNRQLYFIKSCK